MKSYRKELWFNIPARRGFVNMTPQVETCLHESEIQEGLILISAMHITASVFINDDESGLHQDYERCWKNSRLMNRSANIATMTPVKTMPTHT
jgi:thiamine phosphate synthase YjbQ (UPF0047 family)